MPYLRKVYSEVTYYLALLLVLWVLLMEWAYWEHERCWAKRKNAKKKVD